MDPAEFERAFGGADRVEWMRWQPSIVSGFRPCVTAHVSDPEGSGGMARRADSKWTVPLTWFQHQEMHNIGEESFAAKYGVDLRAKAIETEARWQKYKLTAPRLPW